MKNTKPKSKKKKILFIILSIVVTLIIAGDWILTVMVYNENFNQRFESYEPLMLYVDDFDGLHRTKYEFSSNGGQKLAGYMYSSGENQRGIVVMAHGFGGGGHNSYMDCVNYFACHGYYVFSYDATGNDESEGEGVGGLPQGVIDLDYAITFVEESGKFPSLPIVLFGHSWGGYCVGSVLNCHTDVKAAVLVAGFNRSIDLFEQQGESIIGSGIKLFMPYVSVYERLKFGKYASYTAIDGFGASDAEIMILHSKDDSTVLPENGYEKFYNAYGETPRFHFIEYEDRGHDSVYYSDAARRYKEQLNKDYTAYVEANGGEYTAEIKEEFMKQNLDKSKCYEFDYDLMQQMLDFYDSAL